MKYTITFLLLLACFSSFGQVKSDTAITSTDTAIFIHGTIRKPIVNPSNLAPTVNAGADKSITLPVSTVQLIGTASDPDGSITKYLWTKSGGGTISSPNAATTNVTGLTAGTYVFTLTVTDNGGATASDNVMVMVNPAPPNNQSPVANAGTDKALILPNNSIDITGTGSDADGTVAAYVWTKVAGPSTFTLANSNTATVKVSNLVAGLYTFRLTVTDNQGASGTDDVNVTVSQLTPPPTFIIEGYASGATGGAGFQTIHITSLSQLASNIGSNRILLIDVSGTISTAISINNVSNLTIDAFSTQQDVTITNNSSNGLSIDNSNNIIIRGLRSINNPAGADSDGFNVTGSSSNILFDHCSAYGNSDGNIDLTALTGKNFSVQWCILGNDKQSGNMLITTINASVHHNLFIGDGAGEGAERNPFAHSRYSPVGAPNVDFRNNLVHASGRYASGTGWNATGNFVNNYYTSNKSGLISFCSDQGHCGSGYISGNFNQPNSVGGTRVANEYTIPAQYKITTTDAVTAGRSVLESVGPYKKTSYEQGVINSITISGNPDPTACTGYIYSSWSACNNGVQTRTVTGMTPNGCAGNPSSQPVLSQSCNVNPDPDNEGYTLVYQNGYDKTADLDPFDHGQIGNGSLSTTIFKTGPGSFKSVPANVSSGIRSEVQYGDGQTPLEGIVEYDVYYDNFFSNSGHSLQWHPSTSGGSGTGLFHKNGRMQFVTVKSGTTGTDVGSSFTVSTKTWHHIKLTYKFGNSGYIKVELDGVVVLPQTNVQMGDGSKPYLKHGVNMWVNQTSVVYYDNLRIMKKN